MKCVLCHSENLKKVPIHVKPQGDYYHCHSCDLVFRDPLQRLNPDLEKARYDFHQNQDTQGYRDFLSKVCNYIYENYSSQDQILDFGCGPTAFLAKILSEKNYQVDLYDLYFHNNKDVFQKKYDVITCTEVIEHVYDPALMLKQISEMLKLNSYFVVLTSERVSSEQFAGWSYRRDVTHVAFYSQHTMKNLEKLFGLKLKQHDQNLWLFQKVT